MQQDSSDHALTTDSADAAAAFDRAVASYVAWRTDTMDHIQAATDADPDFALPYAAKGILTIGLRKPELRAPAEALLAAAPAARTPETERERRYIAALDAAIGGRITPMPSPRSTERDTLASPTSGRDSPGEPSQQSEHRDPGFRNLGQTGDGRVQSRDVPTRASECEAEGVTVRVTNRS